MSFVYKYVRILSPSPSRPQARLAARGATSTWSALLKFVVSHRAPTLPVTVAGARNVGLPSQFIKSTKVLMATPQGLHLGYHTHQPLPVAGWQSLSVRERGPRLRSLSSWPRALQEESVWYSALLLWVISVQLSLIKLCDGLQTRAARVFSGRGKEVRGHSSSFANGRCSLREVCAQLTLRGVAATHGAAECWSAQIWTAGTS